MCEVKRNTLNADALSPKRAFCMCLLTEHINTIYAHTKTENRSIRHSKNT